MAAGSTASLVYSLGVLKSPSLLNAPSIGRGHSCGRLTLSIVLRVVASTLREHVLGLGQCSFESSAQTRVFPEEDTGQISGQAPLETRHAS